MIDNPTKKTLFLTPTPQPAIVRRKSRTVYRMLKRQRAILSMLDEAGGRASRLAVTKWAFLLREEYPSHGGSSFYQFVPYQFGPFSFCLFQEAMALERHGLLQEDEHDWVLTDAGREAASTAENSTRRDVRRLLGRHEQQKSSELIDYVYERYPWYTVNSKIRRCEERCDAEPAVYTAGYEGLLVDGFLDGLMRNGIRCLVDVRNNPVSRRYGYHKSTLKRLASNLGIRYEHVPELGIQSDRRQDLDRPGARAKLFANYSATTLRSETSAIERVAEIVTRTPSVLVCMEACPDECHRSHLAIPVAEACGLPITHLELKQ